MAACGHSCSVNQRQRQGHRPFRTGTLATLGVTVGARGLVEAVQPPLRLHTGETHESILADPSRAGFGAMGTWLSVIQRHDA